MWSVLYLLHYFHECIVIYLNGLFVEILAQCTTRLFNVIPGSNCIAIAITLITHFDVLSLQYLRVAFTLQTEI